MRPLAALLVVIIVGPASAQPAKKPLAATLEVRLTDGSRVQVAIVDESLAIQTPHGKLVVPTTDVRRIEFGPRLPEEVHKRIDTAVAELASTETAKREAAGEVLLKIGPPAYPAVVRLTKSSDRDLAITARRLREQFLETFAEQRLPSHDLDVIYTDEAKIAGRLEATTLRVFMPQFGEKTLKVTDLVSVRGAGTAPAEENVTVQPDPGTLTSYAQQTGKSFYFTVTGNIGGSVYGTDLYTTDSTLATAAVHAGLLKQGETGTIKVTIEPGAASYTSSTRNGVTTYDWGSYHASYKVSRVKENK